LDQDGTLEKIKLSLSAAVIVVLCAFVYKQKIANFRKNNDFHEIKK